MDSLPLYFTTTTTSTTSVNSITAQFCLPSSLHPKRSRNVSLEKKNRKVSVLAAKDEPPKLDPLDQMELKFGKMLGEDPKLTLAKIMARKSNPDMSYLEIEKSFEKKKGNSWNNKIEEVPFDVQEEKRSVNSPGGLNLFRPMTRKGVKIEASEKPVQRQDKKPTQAVGKAVENSRRIVPNVLLRKPSVYDDVENEKSSRLSIRPNLSLRMGKEPQKERFSDITLLKKPEPLKIVPNHEGENDHSGGSKADDVCETGMDAALLRKPELLDPNFISDQADESLGGYSSRSDDVNSITDGGLNNTNSYAEIAGKGNLDQALESRVISSLEENESVTGLQPSDSWSSGKSSDSSAPSATKSAESDSGISLDAALLGKPKRLDNSVMTTSKISKEEVMPVNPKSNGNSLDLENFLKSPIKEREENDWAKAEDLVNSGGREEVEITSSSTRGFTVSFGSLIGFLPYRNLASKWKFLAFESWLRRRGLDPSKYKQHLGVIGSFETAGVTPYSESRLESDIDDKLNSEISPDTKLDDLLRIYDQQKSKFLSSFVGQKIKVTVVLADRRSRRLIFSTKRKEKEELVEKKRNLMARLSVGDVVKCCIKKITYFGIFVEVEEVPALIHQTEVSWDSTLDPASDFKIGQIVEAKVHQLDFSLGRIFLSLKEITPDPLIEALEAVVGGHVSLDGRLEAAQADSEWAEMESLIKELQQVEGIQSVSKGRYFSSPGLAPTFQVYMASLFENQYKLLARSGNRAQEVIVETSLGKEEMKSIILTCTNRVQ